MSTPVAAVRPVPIRLVAIDLDGTLLDANKKVGTKTADALRELHETTDVRIVLATARPPRSVRPIYRELRLDTWQVNYNGALIWDEPAGRAHFHRPMPGKLCLEMCQLARDLFDEVLIHAEIMDKWFTDRRDDAHTTETGKLFKPDAVGPIDDFCRFPVTKLMMLGEPAILTRIETALLDTFADDVGILHTDRDLLQIMDKRVSKGVALSKVAGHFGIRPSQTLAIGDNLNDAGMMTWAGRSVAMGNAHKHIKKLANWTAPTNDEDGVHAALEWAQLLQK
ncbi:MAG: Cof-type HAD-IIB family hydrolase [Planctomycetota bacterium]